MEQRKRGAKLLNPCTIGLRERVRCIDARLRASIDMEKKVVCLPRASAGVEDIPADNSMSAKSDISSTFDRNKTDLRMDNTKSKSKSQGVIIDTIESAVQAEPSARIL